MRPCLPPRSGARRGIATLESASGERPRPERTQVNEALHESQERLSLALKSSAMGTWDWHITENRIIWDESTHVLYGLRPGEFGGTIEAFAGLVHPADQEGVRRAIDRSLREHTDYAVENRVIWPDGSIHYIATRGKGYVDRQGQVDRMIGVSWDVTEHRRDEEAIRTLNAELEQRVAERTAELSEANQRLTELDRMKSQFVSNVSHELRTPLTNVKLYLSLLERGKPEKRDLYMATARREADLLQRLIEDLLHLSRLDLGKIVPELAPVNLSELVGDLVADRAALVAGHGLTLDVRLGQDLPAVKADARMLAQVLTNLMTNAMNYAPAGAGITVSTQTCVADGRTWATFSVADTGPGISCEDRRHLFERFYRGEAARKSGAPGTGLGLSISHEILQQHGGKITVDSEVGQGSTFTVWLPAAS